MPIKNITGADHYVLQAAISAYSDEAFTNARKLSGTDLVGSNPDIDTNTETYVGTVRWHKPVDAVINIGSISDDTDGTFTSDDTTFLTYIKTVRTAGKQKVNLQKVITQVDGLAKFGRDFGEYRAQDEHDALLATLKGVGMSELMNGSATGSGATGLGGQTFDNDPTDQKYGFYVDLGGKLVTAPTTSSQGAQRAEGFLQALGMAWKDYEPEYCYLVVTPEILASLRSANLVDQTTVTSGNITFNSIFQGKFRLIQTRSNQSLSTAQHALFKTTGGDGAGVPLADVSTKTSYLVLPGSLAFEQLEVPESTEIERSARSYKGTGTTQIWHRWGYVIAPKGYDWTGSQDAFPSNAGYGEVTEDSGTTYENIEDVTTIANARHVFNRKYTSALSLGILPVFHS
ncbi:MAG: hypothetical protein DRQ60_06970 [Gammaproteobacteria bacterium]|nr:MAG: hypothetical protein DRQ60_06970 [Gammaproteobacteria bacterium]